MKNNEPQLVESIHSRSPPDWTATYFDNIRHYSTIFDIIQQYSTIFNIDIIWRNSTFFDRRILSKSVVVHNFYCRIMSRMSKKVVVHSGGNLTLCLVTHRRRNFSAPSLISSLILSLPNRYKRLWSLLVCATLSALPLVATLLALSHPGSEWEEGSTSTKSLPAIKQGHGHILWNYSDSISSTNLQGH